MTVTLSEARCRSVGDLVLETRDQRVVLDWSLPAWSLPPSIHSSLTTKALPAAPRDAALHRSTTGTT